MFGPQRTMSLRDAYDFASKAMIKNMMAADAAEGMTAFVEKRKPVWTGR
jgi:enoyl-CoA hydratase/carnithine racemase